MSADADSDLCCVGSLHRPPASRLQFGHFNRRKDDKSQVESSRGYERDVTGTDRAHGRVGDKEDKGTDRVTENKAG